MNIYQIAAKQTFENALGRLGLRNYFNNSYRGDLIISTNKRIRVNFYENGSIIIMYDYNNVNHRYELHRNFFNSEIDFILQEMDVKGVIKSPAKESSEIPKIPVIATTPMKHEIKIGKEEYKVLAFSILIISIIYLLINFVINV